MTNKEIDRYILEFLDGNESSFDQIYEATKDAVFLSIYNYVKDSPTIEDLMQDTYMKAINALNYYRIGTNFRAWISKIARNHTINYVDRKNRETIVDEGERPDLFGNVENDYFLDLVTKNLTVIEKDIIMYRFVLDLTFKEIAKILERPLGTIYTYYREALKKLKEEMKSEDS